ncbi:MAG: hypothetical protein U0744_05840 [Gemmataceae bacterium]
MTTKKFRLRCTEMQKHDSINHGDSSEHAQGDYRKEFASLAEAYRRGCDKMGRACLPGMSLLLAGSLIPAMRPLLLASGFLYLLVVPIVFALRIPSLRCPACRDSLRANFQRFGRFCPTCGGEHLKPGSILKAAECPDCGVQCANVRYGTSYVVHACTHCGVWLDDQGV